MIQLFNVILFQPLFNLLVFLYNVVPGHDLGIAIILLTILIKVLLYPLAVQSIRSQKAMQDLQPKMEAIKKQYKDEKEKQAKAMMDLYKQEHVNPLSSCLPLLIQLPFLIAVYQVFISGIKSSSLNLLYPFIANPGTINVVSFGIIDWSKPQLILAALTGLAQFWQSKMLITTRPPKNMPGSKDEDMMAMMNKQMLYFMPVMTVVIGASLPSGLVLYWLAMTLLTVLQQWFMFRKTKPAKLEVIS
ncbi:MAG: YidC/Oxa1 family membrane protein insertase [Patescibacteria group bacterium]|jgi:YidC/Oxa1 family membrane protein insertase